MVIGGTLQIPFVILSMLRTQPGLPLGLGLMVMQTAAQSVSQILVSPIYMISFTLLYYDIRIRKEGFDLQVMAENLGQTS